MPVVRGPPDRLPGAGTEWGAWSPLAGAWSASPLWRRGAFQCEVCSRLAIRFLVLLLLLSAAWGSLAVRNGPGPGPGLDSALQRAEENHELVLVQFLAADRPLCVRMEEETLSCPEVRAQLASGWQLVRVDATREAELFHRLLGENGVLASVALSSRGEPLAAWRGFAPALEFAAFLERAREQAPEILAALRRAETGQSSAVELVELGERLAGAALPARARDCFQRVMRAPDAEASERARAELGLADLALARGENLAAGEALASARALSPVPCPDERARVEDLEARLAILERRAAPDDVTPSNTR